jgi:hypothetical protein
VVRDLEHVDAQIGSAAQQLVLRGLLDVAGEQHGESGQLDEQHDGRVVGVRLRAAESGGRPQHRVGDPTRSTPLADQRALHRHAGGREPACYPRRLVGRFVERPDLRDADTPTPKHPGEALDVVGVHVGEDHSSDPAYAERAQAVVDRLGIGPGVDHDHGRTVPHDERVALPDITRDERPPAQRPAGRDDRDGDRYHEHGGQRGADEPPGQHPPQAGRQADKCEGRTKQPGYAVRPR